MNRVLMSFGHGYSAQALARRLLPRGWTIRGTTRSAENLSKFAADGVEGVLWPGGDLAGALETATHVLASAGPGERGDPILDLMEGDLARLAGQFAWVGYLSTTGVYGDHQGGWVDESTPPAPATERGRMRVQAERQWRSVSGLPLHIFRLAGIYGPGRGPFEKVRRGTARRIVKEGQVFSRIHVDDVAQVLEASIAQPDPGAVYNVCDDDPAPPEDVIAYAAELLGAPPPPEIPFEQAQMTPMARSFYAESKRVCNARMRSELGVSLLHPGYRDGLRALLEREAGRGGG